MEELPEDIKSWITEDCEEDPVVVHQEKLDFLIEKTGRLREGLKTVNKRIHQKSSTEILDERFDPSKNLWLVLDATCTLQNKYDVDIMTEDVTKLMEPYTDLSPEQVSRAMYQLRDLELVEHSEDTPYRHRVPDRIVEWVLLYRDKNPSEFPDGK